MKIVSVKNDDEILFKSSYTVFSYYCIIVYLYIAPYIILNTYKYYSINQLTFTTIIVNSFCFLFYSFAMVFIITPRYYFYKDKIIKIGLFKKETVILKNINKIEISKEGVKFYTISDIYNKEICHIDWKFHTNIDKINPYFNTYLPKYQELLVYSDK